MFRRINGKVKKVAFVVQMTALCSVIVLSYQSYQIITFEFRHHINESSIGKYNYQKIQNYKDTESCILPIAPVIPEFFKKKWKPTIQDCSYEKKLVVLENDTHLRFLPNVPLPCCLQEVTKNGQGLTACKYVEGNVSVGMKEDLMIKCGRYIQAEVHIPIKPQVQEKIAFWKNVPLGKRPISVFLFGVDTTSRSHAYRSLPRSIELMTKLGFHDFHSYHSLAPSTLENFMGFLMGLTKREARSSCAPDWSTPFDECPLIWKKYSERKYVTSYIEDGSETFNWAKKSGFKEPPTDYYVNYLFQQLRIIRNDGLTSRKKVEPDCASTETFSEFILRYNRRFLQNFSKIPFFLFSWISYPFHDDIYALPSLDSKLAKLFEMISSNKDLLENTVIIFLSDHGDRTSDFSANPESYIERRLPPLFIRMPDRVKKKHPEIVMAVKTNSEKFTTPFDIHETLLHILSLDSNHSSNGSQADRSSLFHEFPRNRTCSNTNIPPANCLCNVQFKPFGNSGGEEGNRFVKKLLKFAIKELNLKVQESNYDKKCWEWKAKGTTPVIFHWVVSRSDKLVDSVIAFNVWPGEAKFEARIKTRVNKDGVIVKNKLVKISRINRYRKQSWCVSWDDRKMRERCYCKHEH